MDIKITYSEKPVTPDEIAVSRLIEEMAKVIKARDYNKLHSLFAASDEFELKKNIETIMENNPYVRTISYQNVWIRILDKSKAVASYSLGLVSYEKTIRIMNPHFLAFRKIGERWYISL